MIFLRLNEYFFEIIVKNIVLKSSEGIYVLFRLGDIINNRFIEINNNIESLISLLEEIKSQSSKVELI